MDRCCGDEEIGIRDALTRPAQIPPNTGKLPHEWAIQGEYIHPTQELLENQPICLRVPTIVDPS